MIQFQFGMPLFLMGFYGSVMVLAVLAIRALLGRWLPKRMMPVLWALVMVRLLVPFYITYVAIEIISGAVRGAGDSILPMFITCVGICVLR